MTSKAAKHRARGAARRSATDVSVAKSPWDMGATGQANQIGLAIEDATEADPETGKSVNPNGVKHARRIDMLERWHRKGEITAGGFNAATALRNSFEETGRTPPWCENDRVDSSPKPDHAIAIQIDRISKFHKINRLVSAEDREIINACVLMGGTPARLKRYRGPRYREGMDRLRAALDRLHAAMER